MVSLFCVDGQNSDFHEHWGAGYYALTRRGSPARLDSNEDGLRASLKKPVQSLPKDAFQGPLTGWDEFGGEVLRKLGGGALVSVVENVAADAPGARGNEQVRPVAPTPEEAAEVLAA